LRRGDHRERDHLEDVGIDWRIMLKGFLEGGGGDGHGLDLSGSRWGQVAGFTNAVMNFGFP